MAHGLTFRLQQIRNKLNLPSHSNSSERSRIKSKSELADFSIADPITDKLSKESRILGSRIIKCSSLRTQEAPAN